MKNRNLKTAFLLAALAVALGAFGAHALKNLLNAEQLHTYQTGVQYHFYHALALAVAGLLQMHYSNKWISIAGNLFIAGLILFSGSLYTLSFARAAGNEHLNWLGAITPLGGVCFIMGWICLFMAVSKSKNS
ncbi:MAG: DUF423 domain-containing protein [Chitinophagaceae bacterium]|nr:DUF423 domain-containing protein [Chitinophagaceae bacterium]